MTNGRLLSVREENFETKMTERSFYEGVVVADNEANTGVDSALLRTIRTAATICQTRHQSMKARLATPAFLNRPHKAGDCRVITADDPHIGMVTMPSLEMMLAQVGIGKCQIRNCNDCMVSTCCSL